MTSKHATAALRTLAGAFLLTTPLAAPARAAEYSVAILQSLTGPAASIGGAMRDGALIAIEEANASGVLGSNKLKAVVEDDASDRGQAVTQINRFANDPATLFVLGPTSGAVALAGLVAANQGKVAAGTLMNAIDDVNGTGPWAFSMTQPGAITAPYLGRYAAETLKVKSCAAVGLNDNPASMSTQKAIEDDMTTRGAKVVSHDWVKRTDTDFSAIATKVAAMKDIDCVFIANYAPQGANLVSQLRTAGLAPNIKLMGYNALASPDFIKIGGAAVEGFYMIADWLPGGVNEAGRAFSAKVQARTGSPPDFWAAVGYSHMLVAINAIRNAGPSPTREAVRDALTHKTKDVPVIIGDRGTYTIDENRVAHYGMAVLMVKGGQFVPAPK